MCAAARESETCEHAAMQERTIERLGRAVSVVGLGTWQLGAEWGTVSEDQARESATRMAREVLSNPIIEDYRVEIEA